MAAAYSLPYHNLGMGMNFKFGYRQYKFARRGNDLYTIFNGINAWPNLDWWIYDNEFYTADLISSDNEWVHTATGTGTTTTADEKGGVLLLTSGGTESDLESIQLGHTTGESFQLVAGKSSFFYCRFKIGDVDDCEAMIGMAVTDTSPLDAAGRLVFRVTEADADGTITFESADADSEDVATADDIVTMTDGNYIEVGFRAEGVTIIRAGIKVSGVTTWATAITDTDDIYTSEMRLTAHIEAGSGAANTMSIDRVIFGCQK